MEEQDFQSRIDLTVVSDKIQAIKTELGRLIIGQNKSIDLLLIALLADGHVLLEGVPGVAKTLLARAIAKSIDTDFKRIQFTPDLMPADITGSMVFNNNSAKFEFHKGPLFSNIILIDEINRAPARTQSALFEVMEEKNITVEGNTYQLDHPFFVLGTQNPVEHEGTYRLPEAQLDRFLFKIEIGLPEINDEVKILQRYNNVEYKEELEHIKAVVNKDELRQVRNTIRSIRVEEHLFRYIAEIINETRTSPDVYLGASPRASLAILKASKALAAMQGRDFITPDDIKYVAVPSLIHRIIPSPEKEIEGISSADIVNALIKKVEVPR